MTFKERQKAKANQLAEKINALLDEHSASTILDALLTEARGNDLECMVDTMVNEVSYRTDYKMLKLHSINEQLAYEDFIEQLYPLLNDRQLAVL
jgi:hypothetical protein